MTLHSEDTDRERLLEDTETEMTTKSEEYLSSPELPVPVAVWRVLLVVAVFLYSSFTIFIHLCEVDGRLPFLSASAVFLVELLKLILSLVMFGMHHGSFSFGSPGLFNAIKTELRQNHQCTTADEPKTNPMLRPPPLSYAQFFRIVLPFMIPAVLYAINNNLGIFIQLEMDPATYQVLGNFKILSTAILFRLIIKRPISPIQWFALILLLSAGFTHSYGSLLSKLGTDTTHSLHITAFGILLISLYCTISGLSGVSTEYIMKKRAQMNIHLQNALLYTFGIALNGLMFVVEVYKSGDPAFWNPLKGYTVWTWLFVVTQAISGIFMGFVMKYSNNITRLFIISSAMLVTTFAAMFIFGLQLNALFIVSFLLVCTSLYLYHR